MTGSSPLSPTRQPSLRSQGRVIALTLIFHLKQMAVDGFIIFTILIQPLLVALLALYMLRESEGFQAIYVIVGSGMTGLWSGMLFFSVFNIEFERWVGTLEQLVGSPTPLATVVLGKTLANVALSLSSMIVAYTLAGFFLDYELHIQQPLGFAVSLGFTVVAFASFGLLLGPLFSVNPGAQQWVNALEFPMFILGGFLFPIALLPGYLTPLSYLLAPYWAARALHGASSGGAPAGELLLCWGLLLAFSGLYVLLAAYAFRKLLFKARVDATLGYQ